MASERRDNQPDGSRFVGEIDHDEIQHIEVSRRVSFHQKDKKLTYFYRFHFIGCWKRGIWNRVQGEMA